MQQTTLVKKAWPPRLTFLKQGSQKAATKTLPLDGTGTGISASNHPAVQRSSCQPISFGLARKEFSQSEANSLPVSGLLERQIII